MITEQNIANIIKPIVKRIRALETVQEGNGFVPYNIPPSHGTNSLTNHGTHTVLPCGASEVCYFFEFEMPRKTANLTKAVIKFIPTGTGTMDYTVETSGGQCGEDEAVNTDSITADGLAVTDDEIECLDILNALTPYTVGDSVGVKLTVDALSTTTAINVLGLVLL